MTQDILLALAAFAFATSITPGPNNIMLMTSGLNFGFRRTIPHMLGVGIGFTLMIVLVGLGLAGLFEAVPATALALKIASVIYMTWLAWKIAHAAPPADAVETGTPITFLQAAAFQWVNPKAWGMALAAVSAYAPDRNLTAILGVALVFGAINLPSVSTWTLLGTQLRRWLAAPARLRAFNWTMAALLMLSLYPVLMSV